MKDEMPLPACQSSTNDATIWHRTRFDPPTPDVEYPSAEIATDASGLVVEYHALSIRLGAEDQPLCWNELVIVD